MGKPSRTRAARRPVDPQARERLREAQAAETRALAAVCDAEAKVASATARRERPALPPTPGSPRRPRCSTPLAPTSTVVSGVDRAAALLGISKSELRRSLPSATDRDGAA